MNHKDTFSLLKQLKAKSIKLRALNGQLKVSSQSGTLDADTVNLLKTNKDQLLNYLSDKAYKGSIRSSAEQRFEPFDLNENQQAYWLGRSASVDGGGVAIHLYFEIDATELDINRLHNTWESMVRRHDMLRAVVTSDGQQKILKEVTVPPFRVIEPEPSFDAALLDTRNRLSHANYDLTKWPQYNFQVVTSSSKKTLCLSIDCWCIDGWSYQILFQEWLQLYRDEVALPAIELSFRDYCTHLDSEQSSRQQQDYIDNMAGSLPPAPSLPECSRSQSMPRFQRYEHWLSGEKMQQLKRWCSSKGVTLASTLLTLYAEVLHLWSSNDCFTVNVPRFNRNSDDSRVNHIIGEFATFSLVGFDFNAEMDRVSRIKCAQKMVLESVEAGVSGVDILRKRNERSQSVQTMPFVFTNAPEWVTQSGEKQSFIDTLQQLGQLEYAISQTPQVKIDCQYHESRDGLYLFWDIREDQFYSGQIEQMFNVFLNGILGLVEQPEKEQRPQVDSVALIHEEHLLQENIWADFSNTVSRYPGSVAIVCDEGEMTWAQLNERVNALSGHIASLGLAPNQPVLIMAEKGWKQVAAFLSLVHQGHTAVPIDCSNPIERIQFISGDTKAPLVLCTELYKDKAAKIGLPTLDIAKISTNDAVARQQSGAESMLIIYTSGSTGQPKGVKIAEVAMNNAVNATIERFQFDHQDVFFGLTQLHHDMAWFDVLAAVKTGGQLVYPASKDYRDPLAWIRQIERHGVTCWNSVPQLMQMLLTALKQQSSHSLSRVRIAFLGGDWIPLSTYSDMKASLPSARLVSVGGPTETTLWNIMYEVETFDQTWSSVPYGKPIANNQYRILDRHGRDCPPWVEGEMCCCGIGVTQGYVNRPELEGDKFFESEDGARYYRTGDIGRYRADGEIEFIGRKDDQIMVGGYRIESQEIHRALESHQAVNQAQVLVDNGQLQGFVVGEHDHIVSAEQLDSLLRKMLPEQMIPSVYFVVKAIPLTGNGKVDKAALASLDRQLLAFSQIDATDILLPKHKSVAALWDQVLGRKPQKTNDDFFLFGGHSLAAVELFALMFPQGHDSHSVVSLFESRTVAQQAELMVESAGSHALVLSEERLDKAELSQSQKRICFVEQMTQRKNLFNLPFRIALSRDCEVELLKSSLERALSQFDVFQSRLVNGQWVRTENTPCVMLEDLPLTEREIDKLSRAQASAILDLSSGKGWVAQLVNHEEGHCELLLTVHHVLFDGWSLQILLKAWQDCYRDEGLHVAQRADYFNYCQWESEQSRSDEELDFWRSQLEGFQDSALLPTQLDPQNTDLAAQTEVLSLDSSMIDALKGFSEQHNTTEFAVMMAAFQLLISRYLSQDDVVIGTHVANRPTVQMQAIPGLFLNNIAIRQRVDRDWRVEQLVSEQTKTLLSAMKHSNVPFERVVSEMAAGGDGNRHPLYQISFVLDNSQTLEGELGCVIKPMEQPAISTELEMNVQLGKGEGRINLVFRKGLFTASSMRRLLGQYQGILKQMIARPSCQLNALCYNSDNQHGALQGPLTPIVNNSIHELWQQVVENTPEAPALIDDGVTYTFEQLNDKAEALACQLAFVGVGYQSRVGVHLDLGEDLLVSLLAIVKLSACYVPLATSLPEGRLKHMVEIAQCEMIIGRNTFEQSALDCTAFDMGAPYFDSTGIKSQQGLVITEHSQTDKPLLYVTFTSGSTGAPKAVPATEIGALNRFSWTWQNMPYATGEVCALKTSISFVDSIAEIFTPLLKGIPLAVIPTQAQYSPEAFTHCLKKYQITRLVMVSSLMETLVEHRLNDPESNQYYQALKYLTLSGETLSQTLADRVLSLWPHIELWNLYGSAEVAADVLARRVELGGDYVTLGKPLLNTTVSLRDNWGTPTPHGGKGEVWVTGCQVISGYLSDTAFPQNSLGEATFATGDMAQFHCSGENLETTEVVFIGRQQQLVKIRGQKVSLAEIKETLVQHELVTQMAVVMVDDHRIGVIYTPETVSAKSLQSIAEQFLPRYMRPQVWHGVAQMPLLATGKVDLKAAGDCLKQQANQPVEARAMTEREREIAQLWQTLTGIDPHDPKNHFFDMGGHSLLVNSLTNVLNKSFGLSLRLGLVYDSLVLSEMAQLIETLVTTNLAKSSIKETGII